MVIPDKKKELRSKPELYQDSVDVISSLSEMKGEVRREIEVMNMKMTTLEQQVATIIDLLKSEGHLHSRASGSVHESQSIDHAVTPPTTNPSPVKLKKKSSPTKIKPSKSQDDDPLPDWLAPPGSAGSQHSIPDWEEEDAAVQNNASSAAKKLNKGDNNGKDKKLMQTLNMMKKK